MNYLNSKMYNGKIMLKVCSNYIFLEVTEIQFNFYYRHIYDIITEKITVKNENV